MTTELCAGLSFSGGQSSGEVRTEKRLWEDPVKGRFRAVLVSWLGWRRR